MEQFHQLAAAADEDEYVTVAHLTHHLLMHDTAKGADFLTHVSPSGATEVEQRVVKIELLARLLSSNTISTSSVSMPKWA